MVKAVVKKTVGPVRKGPVRPRFLSETDVASIVEIVRHWHRSPMTWENIRLAVARDLLGQGSSRPPRAATVPWSRQALSNNKAIKKAYTDRRQELAVQQAKGQGRRARSSDPETIVLRRQVESLTIEVKTLNERLAAYENRFRTMLLNRALGATTESAILEPLAPKIERRVKD